MMLDVAGLQLKNPTCGLVAKILRLFGTECGMGKAKSEGRAKRGR